MSIDGVNNTNQIVPLESKGVQNEELSAIPPKLNSVFENKPQISAEVKLPDELPELKNPVKMTSKEAKNWVKAYREEHGCSKKEAKAAFEAEFGYKMPRKGFMQYLRQTVFSTIPGAVLGMIHSGKEVDNWIETGHWKS